tara:strand:+ start:59 stop:844 length:786 start_codon:yes stop_codon:yes gene_type:complete
MDDIKYYYNYLGFCKLDSFFHLKYIDEINEIIDNLNLKPSETVFEENNTGKIKQIQYLYKYHERFNVLLESLINIAKILTKQDDLYILNMQLFEKHPKISKETRAHQDNAYFKLNPPNAITFWISLDDINKENGSLYYVPKSHLGRTLKHDRYNKNTTFRVRSGVSGLSLCLPNYNLDKEIIMPTKKGDVLIHHCNLIHRAGKNNSLNRRRRSIGIVFIPNNCKVDEQLNKIHCKQLKEDIELQREKNPELYERLLNEYQT